MRKLEYNTKIIYDQFLPKYLEQQATLGAKGDLVELMAICDQNAKIIKQKLKAQENQRVADEKKQKMNDKNERKKHMQRYDGKRGMERSEMPPPKR